MTVKRLAVCLGLGALGLSALPAWGQELPDLKKALEQLQHRIDELEKKQRQSEAAPSTVDGKRVVTEGDLPNSLRLPNGATFKIGGFIDMTMRKEFGPQMGGTFFIPGLMPLPGSPIETREGHFFMTARRSQANLTVSVPTPMGLMTAYMEGDFYGAGGNAVSTNSAAFRLRKA